MKRRPEFIALVDHIWRLIEEEVKAAMDTADGAAGTAAAETAASESAAPETGHPGHAGRRSRVWPGRRADRER